MSYNPYPKLSPEEQAKKDAGPASEAQKNLMTKLNLIVPANLTMGEAKKIISTALNKEAEKPPAAQSYAKSKYQGAGSPPFPASGNRDKSIVRQNVLNRAIELVVGDKIALDTWQMWAEEFEKWVNR